MQEKVEKLLGEVEAAAEESSELVGDVADWIKKYPLPSMLLAMLIGIILGIILRRR